MLITDSIYILIFISGLFGGFGHCIGMCGPVVVVYSTNMGTPFWGPHLLFNLGRVTTYTVIGGVMGLTGSFAGTVQIIEEFQNITMLLVGGLMILMGLSVAGLIPLVRTLEQARLSGFLIRIVKSILESGNSSLFYPMGLVLGFIPCGLVYTAFIAAAGVGASSQNHIDGLLKGMFMLFLFGIATSLSLLVLGKVVSAISERFRIRLYKASAILMVITGIIFIYRVV